MNKLKRENGSNSESAKISELRKSSDLGDYLDYFRVLVFGLPKPLVDDFVEAFCRCLFNNLPDEMSDVFRNDLLCVLKAGELLKSGEV
jgi:hypothetical protein